MAFNPAPLIASMNFARKMKKQEEEKELKRIEEERKQWEKLKKFYEKYWQIINKML